jgi:hypothetical protein
MPSLYLGPRSWDSRFFPGSNGMIDPKPLSEASTKPPEDAPPYGERRVGPIESLNPIEMWMHRISVFLFVLISAVAGVLLIILPWTPEWTDNYLLLSFPSLRTLVSNGFFRGICSGLGLLDIWIGFWEALHYHEQH